MTKDFKKQAAADSTFGQFGLGWMAGGIALGLLIGAGMYALANKGNPPDNAATNAPQTVASTAALNNAAPAEGNAAAQPGVATSVQDVAVPSGETSNETPGFSYHAVLPQLEVDVPVAAQAEQQATADKRAEDKNKPLEDKQEKPAKAEPEAKPVEAAPAEPPAIQPIPTGFNGFQIGSYKTEGQATDMQNRLKRGGLNSRIEQANVKGEVWFRVRLGPATSPDMMQKWQQTLSGMGISPLAVRM